MKGKFVLYRQSSRAEERSRVRVVEMDNDLHRSGVEGYSYEQIAPHLGSIGCFRGDRFFLERFADENWQARETARLNSGRYRPLPAEWHSLVLPTDHFCHRAENDPECVAFTESSEKGRHDVQTRMRAGKYLSKFMPSLDSQEVRNLAEAIKSSDCELQLTDDPELASRIYAGGPHSCMKKKRWGWHRKESLFGPMPQHPVAAYFGGDLKIAWLGEPEAATARVLVWPSKKIYGRIYGAVDRMTHVLRRAGYESVHYVRGKNFDGARIKVLRYDRNRVVMPYCDHMSCFEYCAETDTATFGNRGKGRIHYLSQNQNGFTRFPDLKNQYCLLSGQQLLGTEDTVRIEGKAGLALRSVAIEKGYLEKVVYARPPKT